MKMLNLEVIENGSFHSLVADSGKIYATGATTRDMLREAAFIADRDGYDTISVGTQTYTVATCKAL